MQEQDRRSAISANFAEIRSLAVSSSALDGISLNQRAQTHLQLLELLGNTVISQGTSLTLSDQEEYGAVVLKFCEQIERIARKGRRAWVASELYKETLQAAVDYVFQGSQATQEVKNATVQRLSNSYKVNIQRANQLEVESLDDLSPRGLLGIPLEESAGSAEEQTRKQETLQSEDPQDEEWGGWSASGNNAQLRDLIEGLEDELQKKLNDWIIHLAEGKLRLKPSEHRQQVGCSIGESGVKSWLSRASPEERERVCRVDSLSTPEGERQST